MMRGLVTGAVGVALLAGCAGKFIQTSSGSSMSSSAGSERASGAGDSQIITLPDTMGMTRAQAEAALRSAGVQGSIYYEGGGNDQICGQTPGGGQQTRTTLGVTLRPCGEVHQAPPGRTEIDLTGLTVEEATKRIRGAGFAGEIRIIKATANATCKVDRVCGAAPSYWHSTQPSILDLRVGEGDLGITVPD